MTVEQARMDQLLREVYGRVPKPHRPAEARPLRSCSRCGIDTRRPDLCVDCQDVTS